MKINIFLIYSLLLLLPLFQTSILCMENNLLLLEDSRIITPTPEKRGLGASWTVDSWIKGKANKLLIDLEEGYFDPENSSYHRIFDDSIDYFVDNKDHSKLSKMLIIAGRKYSKNIKPTDIPSSKAHKYLTIVHQEKLETLKKDISEINKKHLQQLNELFTKIQNQSSIFSNDAQITINDYKNKQATLTQTSCDDIKKNKIALCNTHCVNGTFLLNKNSYCSDYESDEEEENDTQNAIKNPNDIEDFYNNSHILKKIEIEHKNEDTLEQLNARLAEIYKINEMLQNLTHLTYIDDEKK